MHVIYDGRVMAEQYSGLGRFAGELLFTLLDMSHETGIKYTVIIWNAKKLESENFYYQKLRQYENSGSCKVVSVPCRSISISQHFLLSHFVNRLDGDIFFYPHFDLPFGVRLPSIVMVHDLHPLKCNGYIINNRWMKIVYFKAMLRVVARKAKFIFAVSETTRKDFLAEVGQHFSNKVGVCLEGALIRSLPKSPALLPLFTLPDHFLLYVGGRRPHKNLKRIVDLFILLKETGSYSGSLMLAGSTKNYNFDVDSYIAGRSDIQIMGQVDDPKLSILYQRMDALVILSKYEGFGLPVAEAGLMKKKMIISDGGSLPEIAPPWAFVLPNDADLRYVVFQIRDYLEGPFVIDENYGKRYTWRNAAQCVSSKFTDLSKSHNEYKSF